MGIDRRQLQGIEAGEMAGQGKRVCAVMIKTGGIEMLGIVCRPVIVKVVTNEREIKPLQARTPEDCEIGIVGQQPINIVRQRIGERMRIGRREYSIARLLVRCTSPALLAA